MNSLMSVTSVSNDRWIKSYSREDKEWVKIRQLPEWVDDWTSILIADDFCFVLGAFNKYEFTNSIAMLQLKYPYATKNLANYPIPLARATMYYTDHTLYVFGGLSIKGARLGNAYRYSLRDEYWETIEMLPKCDYHILATPHTDRTIYLIGGNRITLSLYTYEASMNTYDRLEDLPISVKSLDGAAAITHKDNIVVVMNNKSLVINCITNERISHEFSSVGRIKNIFIYDDFICCMVLFREMFVFKKYDEKLNTWSDTDIPSIKASVYNWSYVQEIF